MNPISTDVIIDGKPFEHEHNNWDHLRTRCGLTHLQCRVCDEKLPLRMGDVSRLSQRDTVPRCDRLHINRRKTRNELREKLHGIKNKGNNGFESKLSKTDKEDHGNEPPSIDDSEKSQKQRKRHRRNDFILEFRDFRTRTDERIAQLEQRIKDLEQDFTTGSF